MQMNRHASRHTYVYYITYIRAAQPQPSLKKKKVNIYSYILNCTYILYIGYISAVTNIKW